MTAASRYTLPKAVNVTKDPKSLARYERFRAMSKQEQDRLYWVIDTLVERCAGHGLGALGALELIEQIGMLLVKQEQQHDNN